MSEGLLLTVLVALMACAAALAEYHAAVALAHRIAQALALV